MELQSIKIKNYRSIEDIFFETCPLSDKSYTYGLIGVNEAGKSSILKAIALKDKVIILSPKDFRDKSNDIEVIFNYKINDIDRNKCDEFLQLHLPSIKFSSKELAFDPVIVKISFAITNPLQPIITITFKEINIDVIGSVALETLENYILQGMHRSIFWTAEDKYLISNPIDLESFSNSPESISVPLKNCFSLADITDIKTVIDNLQGDSTEIEDLQNNLGESVTNHIKTVWPNHPITITFLITNGTINFHVKDTGTKGKAKTADQRSDGFKQFVSFLLTISAQNRSEELSNSILLLDEPETHLHPQAQEYLRNELMKITQNDRNNIVFFATHSNFMIDRKDLSRNFRIKKQHDKTAIERLSAQASTYASVNYEIFDILSSDYHNELYAKLHLAYQNEDLSEDKREGIINFDSNYLNLKLHIKKDKPYKEEQDKATLPTFIRNCIHHPDNGNKYTESELKKSIELLRSSLNNVVTR